MWMQDWGDQWLTGMSTDPYRLVSQSERLN